MQRTLKRKATELQAMKEALKDAYASAMVRNDDCHCDRLDASRYPAESLLDDPEKMACNRLFQKYAKPLKAEYSDAHAILLEERMQVSSKMLFEIGFWRHQIHIPNDNEALVEHMRRGHAIGVYAQWYACTFGDYCNDHHRVSDPVCAVWFDTCCCFPTVDAKQHYHTIHEQIESLFKNVSLTDRALFAATFCSRGQGTAVALPRACDFICYLLEKYGWKVCIKKEKPYNAHYYMLLFVIERKA